MSAATSTVVVRVYVPVMCPWCDKRQPVDVPPGTMVDAKCVRCGGKFEREVRG